ncbi:MAG: glycosyltransferase family 4 protein [Nanoarchaeota archaeon]
MKNNVLVMASTFPRYSGDSTPRFVFDLSKRLISAFNIVALAPHDKNSLKIEKMEGLDVRRFAYFKPESMQKICYGGGIIPNMKNSLLATIQMPFLIISEFFAAKKIIKNERINLVHAHWMLPQGLVGVWLKKIYNVPLIVTIHGSDLFPLKNRMLMGLQRFVCKNADFITANKAAADELVSRFPEFKEKIAVIPMGVDIDIFKKRAIKKPAKYSKNKLLVFVGRLSDQKGLQYVIEAMPAILSHDDSVKLIVIGEGPYEKELRQKIKLNSVQGNVDFLGALPSSDVSKYYNMADIFILPSLSNKTGTEALGLSLLEAMSSGCAVIGTDVGGIKFVIKNSVNGIIIKQKSSDKISKAVVSLLDNPKKRELLGKNASAFVKNNYSWQEISKKFEDLYKKVLK